MINSIRPYPAYKETDKLWLGQIPRIWKVVPNRALFKEVNDRNFPDEEMLSVTITTGVILQSILLSNTDKKDSSREDKTAYKLVQPRDIVYNKMRAWQGAIGASKYRGIVSPAYIIQRPQPGVNTKYFHYLFRTPAFAKEAERWSYGITSDMWSLRPEHFKVVYSCLPLLEEQKGIVNFLDWTGRRIERLILARQKRIKLLEEYKQASIHSAITGAIDVSTGKPYPAYKHSGVKWLGEVPEHWILKRFKFIAQIKSGQVDPRLPEQKQKILIAPNHIESGTGEIVELSTADIQGAESGKYEVFQGQIIYSKIRPNLRKASIAPIDCLCSADMYPISIRENEIRPVFLLLLLLSRPFTEYTADYSMRVAMPKVNRKALGEALMWYPGLDEQDEIIKFFEQIKRPIDASIAHTRRQIALLEEFRDRQIYDVTTGKLDVRDAAASLAEESVTNVTDSSGRVVTSGAEEGFGREEIGSNDEEVEL